MAYVGFWQECHKVESELEADVDWDVSAEDQVTDISNLLRETTGDQLRKQIKGVASDTRRRMLRGLSESTHVCGRVWAVSWGKRGWRRE